MIMNYDPTIPIPQDPTGSYLHLKLKRYSSISDLTMPFAKKTWQDIPHHAEVEEKASSSRSKCRQCHETIDKGTIRCRLWLQCHKGCKISSYFHGETCIWQYPETKKLNSLEDEFIGFHTLSETVQNQMKEEFCKMKQEIGINSKKKKNNEEEKEVTGSPSKDTTTNKNKNKNKNNEDGEDEDKKESPQKRRRLEKEYS